MGGTGVGDAGLVVLVGAALSAGAAGSSVGLMVAEAAGTSAKAVAVAVRRTAGVEEPLKTASPVGDGSTVASAMVEGVALSVGLGATVVGGLVVRSVTTTVGVRVGTIGSGVGVDVGVGGGALGRPAGQANPISTAPAAMRRSAIQSAHLLSNVLSKTPPYREQDQARHDQAHPYQEDGRRAAITR